MKIEKSKTKDPLNCKGLFHRIIFVSFNTQIIRKIYFDLFLLVQLFTFLLAYDDDALAN